MPNSSAIHFASDALTGTSETDKAADSAHSAEHRKTEHEETRVVRVRKRRRLSSRRNQKLRRSQSKLAWCIGIGASFGMILGFEIGIVPIGLGIGLAIGLAVGVLAAN